MRDSPRAGMPGELLLVAYAPVGAKGNGDDDDDDGDDDDDDDDDDDGDDDDGMTQPGKTGVDPLV